MTTESQFHPSTLANARDHIAKMEKEMQRLRSENARLKPKQTETQATKNKKDEKPFYPIPFISRPTPESHKLYSERIAAAQEYVQKTEQDVKHAKTLEEQNRALELYKNANQDLQNSYSDYSGMEWLDQD